MLRCLRFSCEFADFVLSHYDLIEFFLLRCLSQEGGECLFLSDRRKMVTSHFSSSSFARESSLTIVGSFHVVFRFLPHDRFFLLLRHCLIFGCFGVRIKVGSRQFLGGV